MRFLGIVFLALLGIVAATVTVILTGHHALVDWLTTFFLNLLTRLPIRLSIEQFLIVAASVSVVGMAIVIAVCGILLAAMGTRVSMRRPEKPKAPADNAELNRLKEELAQVDERHQGEFHQLLQLESILTERLDRRFLIQSIIEAARRVTSTRQADSAVSLWLLNFGNDTFDFETGIYCDQTMFTKSSFQLTEKPFAQAVDSKQIVCFPTVDQELNLADPAKVARLGSANSMMVIPLVIENAVLGVLLAFCHPDTLKAYEERRPFFDVTWNQLTLALAVAVQGELATADRLTGVHNRDYFLKRLHEEIDRSNRYELPLSLLMIDIDNFKPVNDTLGHLQGDAVLKIVAKLIKHGVRAIDLIGRYGGEEFVVLLPETGFRKGGDEPGPTIVGERVRKAIEEEFEGMQKPLGITVSVGAVVRRFPEDRELDTRALIRLADEQLYRAKTAGKNRVCVAMPDEREKGHVNPSKTSSPSEQA